MGVTQGFRTVLKSLNSQGISIYGCLHVMGVTTRNLKRLANLQMYFKIILYFELVYKVIGFHADLYTYFIFINSCKPPSLMTLPPSPCLLRSIVYQAPSLKSLLIPTPRAPL